MRDNDILETKQKAKEISTLSALAKEMAFSSCRKKGIISKIENSQEQIHEYSPDGFNIKAKARNSIFIKKASINTRISLNSPGSNNNTFRKDSFDPNDTYQLRANSKDQQQQTQRGRKSRSESFQTSMSQSLNKNPTVTRLYVLEETPLSKEIPPNLKRANSIFQYITSEDDKIYSDWSEGGSNEFESEEEEEKENAKSENKPKTKRKSIYDRGMKCLKIKNSKIEIERIKKIKSIENQLQGAPSINEESRKISSNSKYIPLYKRASELYSKRQTAICMNAKKKELNNLQKENDEAKETNEILKAKKQKVFNQYDWDSFMQRQNQLLNQNKYKKKAVSILNDDLISNQAAPKINAKSKAIVKQLMENNNVCPADSVYDRLYRDNEEHRERQIERNNKAIPRFKPKVNKVNQYITKKKSLMTEICYDDNDNDGINEMDYGDINQNNQHVISSSNMKSKQSCSRIINDKRTNSCSALKKNNAKIEQLNEENIHNKEGEITTTKSNRFRNQIKFLSHISRSNTDNNNNNTTMFTNVNNVNAKSKDESVFHSKGNTNTSISRVKTCIGLPMMFEEVDSLSKKEMQDKTNNDTITDYQTDISERLYKLNIRNSSTGRNNTDILYVSPSDFAFLTRNFL